MAALRAVVGGRVYRNGRFELADVLIRGDQISAVAPPGVFAAAGAPAEVLDASGFCVLPGLLDVHVHFREPGLERKEGWITGSQGALHGGVTSVLEIQNNPPLTVSRARLEERLALVSSKSFVDFGLYPNLVAESLDALSSMAALVPAYKLFMGGSTGMGGITDYGLLRDFFAAAAASGRPIVVHAEEESILRRDMAARPQATARDHHLVRASVAETVSIAAALELAAATGASVHIFHISTGRGADLVAQARASGLDVTGSTAPHYMLLTHEDAERLGNFHKVNPSIKTAKDRDRICERVADGTLAAVGTDHAPHPIFEKSASYHEAPSGLPSVDLVLPLMMELVRRGLPLECALRSVSAGAAECFRIEGKGAIAPGYDADLVLVDLDEEREVRGADLPSKSKWSPYEGWKLRGFPRIVVRRGSVAMEAGRFRELPLGMPLRIAPPAAAH